MVAGRGADLGGPCIKCGHPDAPHRRHIELSTLPPAAWLALISPPVFVVVALLTRQRSSHWINLCGRCTEAWNQSERGGVASAFAVVGSVIASGALVAAGFFGAAAGMFLGGPAIGIAGMIASRRARLTATRIDPHEVRIHGVGSRFLAQAGQPLLPAPAATPWTSDSR